MLATKVDLLTTSNKARSIKGSWRWRRSAPLEQYADLTPLSKPLLRGVSRCLVWGVASAARAPVERAHFVCYIDINKILTMGIRNPARWEYANHR